MSDFVTPWTVAHQALLSSTVAWSLLKFMSIRSVMLSNPLILCHLLILLPSIFPSIRICLYLLYIMRNAGLEEAQAGIKIARRNTNNLRYAGDTTLMAESKEELKSPLMKVKEERKSWLKTQHSGNKDHGIQSHHFMGNRWGNSGNSVKLYFSGLQNHCRW